MLYPPTGFLLATCIASTSTHADAAACHADVLVKNMDPNDISALHKAMVGRKVAAAIALSSGISPDDVLGLDHKPGSSNLLNTGQVAPWLPANWKEHVESVGSAPSTMVSCLIEDCTMVGFMADIFRNPKVHATLLDTILSSLAETDANSPAVEGKLTVVATSVVLLPSSDSVKPAIGSKSQLASPLRKIAAQLPSAALPPPMAASVRPSQVTDLAPTKSPQSHVSVHDTSKQELRQRTKASGLTASRWWAWLLIAVAIVMMILSCRGVEQEGVRKENDSFRNVLPSDDELPQRVIEASRALESTKSTGAPRWCCRRSTGTGLSGVVC